MILASHLRERTTLRVGPLADLVPATEQQTGAVNMSSPVRALLSTVHRGHLVDQRFRSNKRVHVSHQRR